VSPMPSTRLLLASIVCSLGSAACDLEPDVGPPLTDRCTNADSDPARAVSYAADIRPLLFREVAGCTPCHDPAQDGALGVQLGGLDLSTHQSLFRGGFNSAGNIVVPGRPCESALFLKVSPGPPFGSRMPFDGPPFFTAPELRTLHDWIAEGAKEN